MKKIIIAVMCMLYFAACAPAHQGQPPTPPVPPGAPAPPPPPPAP